MKRLFLTACAILTLLALLLAGGCGDGDPTEPAIDPDLQGQVVDEDGNALADVAIGLIYDVPNLIEPGNVSVVAIHPLAKPTTVISFDLPEGNRVRVWVTDRTGRLIITLFDEVVGSGTTAVPWSAVDENGDPVPSGMYTAHAEREGEPVEVRDLLLVYLQPVEFLNAPNAVTDADGRFRISEGLIPVGDVIQGVSETGEELGDIVIGKQLRVVAVREGDPDPVSVQITVDYERGADNSGYRIALPR